MPSSIVSFTTESVPPHQRLRYWNEWSSSAITRSTIRPIGRDIFNGKVKILEAKTMRFANFVSDPATLAHTQSHICAQNDHAMILHLQLDGDSYNEQDGRSTTIYRGDYTLCDAARPYYLGFERRNDMLSLRIPGDTFRERIPAPELLTCLHMSGRTGIGRLVSRFITDCWHQIQEGLDPLQERMLADNILAVLTTSYAVVYRKEVDQSSIATARKLLVKQYIEENLLNPELCPEYVAGALGYTPGYLHRVFRNGEETISQYILRRRLEVAARMLSDPLSGGRQVAEIAFRAGFKNATHFGRVFRDKYGMTPTEYRGRMLDGDHEEPQSD
jgi:AraC-like DNA-binding protein